LKHYKVTRFRLQPVRQLAAVGTLNDEANVTKGLPVVKPHALELIDRHRRVSPCRISNQHAVPHDTAKDYKMIVAWVIDRNRDWRALDSLLVSYLHEEPVFAVHPVRRRGARRAR
jgi:hypothetical protein